ncbi:hypothetical protein [Bacillus cereus]|uniref:hypothetical protein n=1 Tax=Bacillus cereus TaxID=1396 RepID=UPI00192D4607|nr:hypothetical protein [Bacillus cereus]MDA2330936.1 hypothetical protein [Bacillus cereus]MDA2336763.1 hypothetical protein [Bacillus cereus]
MGIITKLDLNGNISIHDPVRFISSETGDLTIKRSRLLSLNNEYETILNLKVGWDSRTELVVQVKALENGDILANISTKLYPGPNHSGTETGDSTQDFLIGRMESKSLTYDLRVGGTGFLNEFDYKAYSKITLNFANFPENNG